MTQQLQKLSQSVGIAGPGHLSILEQVKANHALLETCNRHDFGSTDPRKLGAKYTCLVCGGTADAVAVTWYERGLAHGGKSWSTMNYRKI